MRISPHPKKYQAKNLISYIKTQWMTFASTRYHCCCLWRSFTLRKSFLELLDRSSLLLSYQTHLRAARGAAHERPFLLGVHHCHWLLIYLNTKQRREIQIRDASRTLYVTNVSCASDNQLRGSWRSFDGISERILCLMPWERALGVVKV